MKNWNRIGKTKAIILGVLSLPNLIFPIGANPPFQVSMILMPLVFASLVVPLISKVNASMGMEIIKPNWNDNPLQFNKPLSFFNFFANFFIAVGSSILIGSAIKFHTLNYFGFAVVLFGGGVFIGIVFAVKWIKKNT
jgi:hypothetical protein